MTEPKRISDRQIEALHAIAGAIESAGRAYADAVQEVYRPFIEYTNRGEIDAPSDGACLDCGRRYGDRYGFPDLIVPDDVWEAINPGSNGGGLLCPSCICARAYRAGVSARAVFTSGPFVQEAQRVEDAFQHDLTNLREGLMERVGRYTPSDADLLAYVDALQAQIAAPVPAERTQGAWIDCQHECGHECDDRAELLAQVERVRAIALEYPENDDVDYTSIARQRLAKRIREALDGPTTGTTEGA